MDTDQIIHSPVPASRSLAVAWGLLVSPGILFLLLVLLILPLEIRDFLILALAVLVLTLSTRNFGMMWVAFILYLPLIHLQAGMFGQAKISGIRIFLMIFLGTFLLLPKPRKFWPVLFKQPVFMGLVLFWGANMVSAVVSGELEAVFRVLSYLEPLVFFIISYFVVVRQPGNWRMLLWAIALGGTYVILLGGLEWITQRPLVEILGIKYAVYNSEIMEFYLSEDRFGLGGRISSTLLQPVYAGLFFSMYAILSTYYVAIYRKYYRSWLLVLLPLCMGMVILTASRGPILALGVALLAFLVFSRQKGPTFVLTVIGLGVLILAIIYLVPGLRAYMQASFDLSERASGNVTQRINLTLTLFDFFKTNPLLGYGPGLIQKAARQGTFGFSGLGGLENQYATILADGGLLAGAAYVVFIIGVFTLARKAYRSGNRELRNAGMLLLVLAAYYFSVVVSVNAILAVGGYLFTIIVGGLAGLWDHHLQYVYRNKHTPT
ncbi:MAG: O-antigen ligase family protein [Chloroflexota bacterium]